MICGWERISTHRASQSMVPKEFCLLGNEIRTQNYIAINTIDIRVNQYSVKRNYEALWQKAKHSQFHIAGLTGYFCIQKKKKKKHEEPLSPSRPPFSGEADDAMLMVPTDWKETKERKKRCEAEISAI